MTKAEILAFHLIGIHCDVLAITRPYAENQDQHAHEHHGPGTIRHHGAESLHYDATVVESALEEFETAS